MTSLTVEVTVVETDKNQFGYAIRYGSFEPYESEFFADIEEMGDDLGRMVCEGLLNKISAEGKL